ncbi:hypothetical protein MAR_038138 [Mya arenaria]|uniref:Uncharacterized protein n=1 Tax=Mya arenaria TaxID=6604 RepID=A0ABY7FUD1_MYAAR|nr:hypothetical protein MAR_038138 [Mya arenaria]
MEMTKEDAHREKLEKWRMERQKEKELKTKRQPSSHKLLATSTSAKPEENSKKLKPVKSRLFDYQTKQKPTGPNKENKLSHMKDTKLDSKRPSNHHVIKPKPDLKRKSRDVHTSVPAKRRYSEALSKHEKSKPFSGILKRKSCVGSFNFTGGDAAKAIITQGNDEGDSQGVESRRLSYTVTPGKDDTARKTFPVAAVTPGVSSRNVRFRTPPNNGLGQEKMKMKKTPKPANESERREALNAWLKSKNKTPSKFRHLMCFHAKQEDRSLDPLTKTSLSVKELSSQPKEDIAKCLRETLKYVTERKIQEASRRGRTPRRSEVQAENVFKSSKVVKKRRRSASQTPCQVVTPVRRSTRRSLQNMPDSLKDRKASYTSIEEVGSKDDILFQPNVALDTILAGVEDDD